MRHLKITLFAMALCATLPAAAQQRTLVPIAAFPGASGTIAYSINDNGTVAGKYDLIQSVFPRTLGPSPQRGFYGPSAGPYKTIVINFRYGTQVQGINNNGDLVGEFLTPSCAENGYRIPTAKSIIGCEAFARSTSLGGLTEPVKDAAGNLMVARATGINSAGMFVGNYCVCSATVKSLSSAFLGTGQKVQKKIDLSFIASYSQAKARGINAHRSIVGFVTLVDANNKHLTRGFLLTGGLSPLDKTWSVRLLNFPETGANTTPYGIDDEGNITGSWNDSVGKIHGFYLAKDLVSWASFDLPGANQDPNGFTQAWGLNNAGQFLVSGDTKKYPTSFVVCPLTVYPNRTGICSAEALASPNAIRITPVYVQGTPPVPQSCPGASQDCLTQPDLAP